MNNIIVISVILGNTLITLGALAACCYLSINDHIGVAIACLFLPLFMVNSVETK